MNINDLCKEIHKNAIAKGFWENSNFNVGEKLMLIVSEVAEALEADRKGKRMKGSVSAVCGWVKDEDFKPSFLTHVKDTFEDELADACIRIFDLASKMDIDLDNHIKAKMRFNSMREHKHGKKY